MSDNTNFVLEMSDNTNIGTDLPSSSSTNSNSNELSSKEANAFFIVLGEISPMLLRYDQGLTVFKRLQKEKINTSTNFKDNMSN